MSQWTLVQFAKLCECNRTKERKWTKGMTWHTNKRKKNLAVFRLVDIGLLRHQRHDICLCGGQTGSAAFSPLCEVGLFGALLNSSVEGIQSKRRCELFTLISASLWLFNDTGMTCEVCWWNVSVSVLLSYFFYIFNFLFKSFFHKILGGKETSTHQDDLDSVFSVAVEKQTGSLCARCLFFLFRIFGFFECVLGL